jgi:hypothetical protein
MVIVDPTWLTDRPALSPPIRRPATRWGVIDRHHRTTHSCLGRIASNFNAGLDHAGGGRIYLRVTNLVRD